MKYVQQNGISKQSLKEIQDFKTSGFLRNCIGCVHNCEDYSSFEYLEYLLQPLCSVIVIQKVKFGIFEKFEIKGVLKRFKIKVLTKGASHSTQNSGEIKWNGQLQFDPTGIFGFTCEGSARPVWTFRPHRPKCPFPFYKTLVPSIVFVSCLQEQ